MLPGTGGAWVPENDWPFSLKRPDAVRNNAVRGPVAATDYISCADTGNSQSYPVIEERIEISRKHHFRRSLGGAIRIPSTQFVSLPISPDPLLVPVTFVRGNIYYGAYTGTSAN